MDMEHVECLVLAVLGLVLPGLRLGPGQLAQAAELEQSRPVQTKISSLVSWQAAQLQPGLSSTLTPCVAAAGTLQLGTQLRLLRGSCGRRVAAVVLVVAGRAAVAVPVLRHLLALPRPHAGHQVIRSLDPADMEED